MGIGGYICLGPFLWIAGFDCRGVLWFDDGVSLPLHELTASLYLVPCALQSDRHHLELDSLSEPRGFMENWLSDHSVTQLPRCASVLL